MMRFRLVAILTTLLALVGSPACLELTSTNGGSGGGGGTSTPLDCSATSTMSCADCTKCVGQSPDGKCAAAYAACQMSAACIAIDNCIQGCDAGDLMCFEKCSTAYPDGGSSYFEYYACVYCGVCLMSCAKAIPCAG